MLHTKQTFTHGSTDANRPGRNHEAKLLTHPNELTSTLLNEQDPGRVRRFKPLDLPTRFPQLAWKLYCFDNIHWNIALHVMSYTAILYCLHTCIYSLEQTDGINKGEKTFHFGGILCSPTALSGCS